MTVHDATVRFAALAALALAGAACGPEGPVEPFDPSTLEAAAPTVVAALAAGEPDEAIAEIERLRAAGEVPDGLDYFLGIAHADAGRSAEAAASLARELERRPGNGTAHAVRAEALVALGRLDEAGVHLERARTYAPGLAWIDLIAGRHALESGDDERAKRHFRDYVQRDQHSTRAAEAHFGLAQIAQRAGAEQEARAHEERSDYLEQVNQYLISYRQRLADDGGDLDAALGIGMAYLSLYRTLGPTGRFLDEAERAFTAVLDADPTRVRALFNMGYVRIEQGRHREAFPFYDRALELEPDHAGVNLNYGMLALREGQTDVAEERFTVVAQAAADPLDVLRARIELAALCEREGRLADTIAHYEACLPLEGAEVPELEQRIASLRERLSER